MSEYQYYEWQTIDRLLSPEEQECVNQLSSHIDVSASRAVVTYNWSSFKHRPKKVLLEYFDAYLYFANWGTVRLIFRFPQGVINETAIEPYCDDEHIIFENHGKYQILEINSDLEYGDGWLQADAGLSRFIGLRDDLIDGDYRLLYLAWLNTADLHGGGYVYGDEDIDWDSDVFEPPVPPGLRNVSPSLRHFIDVVELDPFLVQAAAEGSDDLSPDKQINYAKLVSNLTRAECDAFLVALADGKAGVTQSLRKRLRDFSSKKTQISKKTPRSLAQLHQRAEILRAAELKRQAEAARRKHIQEMEELSRRENRVWSEVEHQLEHGRRIASVYDTVTEQLTRLQQLAEYKDKQLIFYSRIKELAQRYASRKALLRRWNRKGWV